MSAFEEILIAFGGNATLLIVLAFLARSLIQTWLAKDVKKFETDLQNTAASQLERLKYELKSHGDASIEQLRSRLQQATVEHQVRFSNLHEERARRIADLYRRIVEQSVACRDYVYHLTESNRQEGFVELEKRSSDLFLFFEKSRIYLPEHICVLVERVMGTLRTPVVGVFVYGQVDKYAPEAARKERQETFMKAFGAFEAEIPAARKALEDEFRRILGVEDSPMPGGAT